ncbi:hypothetical protein C3V36_06400 [Lachnospiraceae bacterium oral taxon 500]|nr:hypothetical protein C3V36_06400 [Lachnospiraceae bacterium oral taxon 500]
MAKTIRQQIFEYIQEKSKNLKEPALQHCTANQISRQFLISRSLASQYLNDMAREGYLIKLKTRPVAFLSRYQLEKDSGKPIKQDGFLSYEELIRFLHGKQQNFMKAIGHEYALKDCIEKIKTAIQYPHGGLPILIYGNHGSGKTFMAERIRDYFFDHGLLQREEQYIYINCNKLDDVRLKYTLFGYLDTKAQVCPGALEKAKDGMIVIDDIASMSAETQENLLQYLETGTYHYANSNAALLSSEARIILIADEVPGKVFSQHFLSHFPFMIELPSLKDRTIREKMALILSFFKRQALISSCEILLSNKVMDYLINQCSRYEILSLKQHILLIFAKAYQTGEKQICVGMRYISDDAYPMDTSDDEAYYNLEYYIPKKLEAYRDFSRDFPELLKQYQAEELSTTQFYEKLFQALAKFNDAVIFHKDYLALPLKRYEKYIESVCKLTENNANIHISEFIRGLLAKYLHMQSYNPEADEQTDSCDQILLFFQEHHPEEYAFTQEFTDILERNFGISLNLIHQTAFLLNQLLYSNDMTKKQTLALIMCHGNATATSIANVVNTLLSSHVFDAFDMPMTSDAAGMLLQVKNYLRPKKFFENLVLIVDMGSLTGIAKELTAFEDANIILISNASTPLALHVGSMILRKCAPEEIRDHLDNVKIECQLIPKSGKEKAILFSSENGINVADKMRLLFEASIPVKTELKLISVDFPHLAGAERKNLLNKYDILFVEGIVDPEIPGVEFINLGEIVSFQAMDRIHQFLGEFLNAEEMDIFRRNLLKNFSLENLMESLTILNPSPLLNLVEETIHRLMQSIGYQIPEKTLISLYVHVCCFIERMVTRTPIRTYHDLERFQQEKKEFIHAFIRSFEKITTHYHVEIPMSEIAYIYDYIEMSKSDPN